MEIIFNMLVSLLIFLVSLIVFCMVIYCIDEAIFDGKLRPKIKSRIQKLFGV
jgi:hypothetical protein